MWIQSSAVLSFPHAKSKSVPLYIRLLGTIVRRCFLANWLRNRIQKAPHPNYAIRQITVIQASILGMISLSQHRCVIDSARGTKNGFSAPASTNNRSMRRRESLRGSSCISAACTHNYVFFCRVGTQKCEKFIHAARPHQHVHLWLITNSFALRRETRLAFCLGAAARKNKKWCAHSFE